ncbi:MAG: hypothetical protein JSS42_10950 [Proteobacteria bacterium]|uniref:hypothetical protein n=1 Tax=Rudaea sp. TaxID=2136325 RepID=UPI0032205B37|nr:hypothetical protein [Pseudomonadota bacterium]
MITVAPSVPSSNDSIVVSVQWRGCVLDRGIDRAGSVFNIHYNYSNICYATAPGGTATFELGQLPTGGYTVNYIQTVTGNLVGQETTSFEVGAADAQAFAAPALGPIGLGILAAALASIALRSRRRSS